MKRLVLGTLIALAATQAAGCIITSGGDDGPTEYAHVAATWTIKSAVSGATVGCPAGYNTAALFNQVVDSSGNGIGTCSQSSHNNESTCFVDLYDCVDGSGISFPLPPTRYKTWVQITDDSTTQLYASTIPAYVDITNVDLTYNAQVLTDGGYFYLDWNLVRASNNQPVECATAGADGVDVLSTDINDGNYAKSDIFDCTDKGGYTAGYRAATYTVRVSAIDTADRVIGTPPELLNKQILPQNQVTDLGLITIPITSL